MLLSHLSNIIILQDDLQLKAGCLKFSGCFQYNLRYITPYAAARVVSNTSKHDRGLSELLHDELHWLDVPQRVDYKLCSTVHRCLQHKAPSYLEDLCVPVYDITSRQHLRSASSQQLVIPRHRRTQFGRRAFSVAGPMAWNALLDTIRDAALSTCSFRRSLKTFLFSTY